MGQLTGMEEGFPSEFGIFLGSILRATDLVLWALLAQVGAPIRLFEAFGKF